MPRFSLRTLIGVMLLGGPAIAGAWWCAHHWEPMANLVNEVFPALLIGLAFWFLVREA